MVLILAGCGAASTPDAAPVPPQPVGLMTTLPIYWPESASVDDFLQGSEERSWVRPALEKSFVIRPIDLLESSALSNLDKLILAQPRALDPQENVALDEWVRGGGRLLLFADPMLTGHTHFSIGDPRRPQDVALLSPILSHWGLELTFDPDAPGAVNSVSIPDATVPVALPGRWRPSGKTSCTISGEGLLASCPIGKGRVIIWADAALLDQPEADDLPVRQRALDALVSTAFR